MRLWHQKLLPYLPRQQLLGQHRECAALRGAGWGRPHSVVNYVFRYDPARLVAYHYLVIDEMRRRGYKPDSNWYKYNWRGSTLGEQEWCDRNDCFRLWENAQEGAMIYPEHNDEYLRECLDNLKGKGIEIEITPIGN